MRKRAKKALLLCLAVWLILSAVPIVSAEPQQGETTLLGYELHVDELDNEVQKYVSDVYLNKEETGWNLRVNGTYLGTQAGPQLSYIYQPNESMKYTISLDTDTQTASVTYNKKIIKTVTTSFLFSLDENAVQSVTFRDTTGTATATRTATKSASGYYDFGAFSFSAYGETVSFQLLVDATTDTAIIRRNGKDYKYSLIGGGAWKALYCEWHVDQHELDMDYMATSLPKLNWTTAQSAVVYSASQIDAAVQNETITLQNNATGLTTTVPLRRSITRWVRDDTGAAVGDGSYTQTAQEVQVICQWDEALCASIRAAYGTSNRPFAVYSSSEPYAIIVKSTRLSTKPLYINMTWPASGWSGYSDAYPSAATRGQYGAVQYRQRAKQWGAWSGYIYTERGADTATAQWQGPKYLYRHRTRAWGAWSGYIYTTAQTLACALQEDCARESTLRWAKRTGTYSAWSGWSALADTTCTETAYRDCATSYRYAYRTVGAWGGWTDYSTNVCENIDTSSGGTNPITLRTRACVSKSQTRYRTRTVRTWAYADYGRWQTDTYGNYTGSCQSESRQSSLCGTNYSYDYGDYRTTEYGSYQSQCLSRTGRNAECGVASYRYSGNTWTLSKHGYTEQCVTKSQQSSLCGTTYSYSNFGGYKSAKYGYTAQCSYDARRRQYRCPTSRTAVNKTCSGYSCPTTRTVSSYNSCTSYKCPTGRTVSSYKTCTLYSCPSARTAATYSAYGAYTAWQDTASCTGNELRECDSRTVYSQNTRYWQAWSDYSYVSVPTGSETASDRKALTQYRTRTMQWSDWTEYTYTACTPDDTTQCDSSDRWRTRYLSDWSAWSDYVYEYDPSCVDSLFCAAQPHNMFSKRTVIGYGAWSSGALTSSTMDDSYPESGYQLQYRYNSGTQTGETEAGTSKTLGSGTYYTGRTTEEEVLVDAASSSLRAYTTDRRMTLQEVNDFADTIYNAAATAGYIAAGNTLLWSDYTAGNYTPNALAGKNAKSTFANEKRFIPYIFITSHFRATEKEFLLEGYHNQQISPLTSIESHETGTQNNIAMYPVMTSAPTTLDTKVVFFDYRDPLANYDGNLPANWQGYEALIEEIKSSDLNDYKIQVTLTRQDLADMRAWIAANPDERGTGEMLRVFRHIFTGEHNALQDWLDQSRDEED